MDEDPLTHYIQATERMRLRGEAAEARLAEVEAERDRLAVASIRLLDAVTAYMLGDIDGSAVAQAEDPLRGLVWPYRAAARGEGDRG